MNSKRFELASVGVECELQAVQLDIRGYWMCTPCGLTRHPWVLDVNSKRFKCPPIGKVHSSSSPKPHTLYASTFFSMMHSSTAFKQNTGRFLISLPQKRITVQPRSFSSRSTSLSRAMLRASFARNLHVCHVLHAPAHLIPSFYHERIHHHRK